MDTLECIKARRSVRKYKSDPVPPEKLNEVLEAFRLAPSWANLQPWELVVVTDPAMKEKLQDTLPKGNPARSAMVQAPVVIAVCGVKGKSGMYKNEAVTALGDWFMFDLGIAAQNLCLAACALGLGTVHAGYLDHQKASELLGLPPDRTVVELVPLGFPDHEPKNPGRKALAEFVHRDQYGKRWAE
jgi:nitroreductase